MKRDNREARVAWRVCVCVRVQRYRLAVPQGRITNVGPMSAATSLARCVVGVLGVWMCAGKLSCMHKIQVSRSKCWQQS